MPPGRANERNFFPFSLALHNNAFDVTFLSWRSSPHKNRIYFSSDPPLTKVAFVFNQRPDNLANPFVYASVLHGVFFVCRQNASLLDNGVLHRNKQRMTFLLWVNPCYWVDGFTTYTAHSSSPWRPTSIKSREVTIHDELFALSTGQGAHVFQLTLIDSLKGVAVRLNKTSTFRGKPPVPTPPYRHPQYPCMTTPVNDTFKTLSSISRSPRFVRWRAYVHGMLECGQLIRPSPSSEFHTEPRSLHIFL